uniref:Uncharacterized protein n=1 Tax=Oryza glumipatula TaxID=40148 RepID=A0A0D9YWG7_9ORYZ
MTMTTTTTVLSPPALADDLDDSRQGSRPPRATATVEKPPHQAPQAAPPLRRSCRWLPRRCRPPPHRRPWRLLRSGSGGRGHRG